MTAQGNTTQRGYGAEHQALRRAAIRQLKANPGQPCPRCTQPMYADQALHLDHTDDRTGYLGLSHAVCNLSAGGRKGGRTRKGRRRWRQPPLRSRW